MLVAEALSQNGYTSLPTPKGRFVAGKSNLLAYF
jgi:hypothetical protein